MIGLVLLALLIVSNPVLDSQNESVSVEKGTVGFGEAAGHSDVVEVKMFDDVGEAKP